MKKQKTHIEPELVLFWALLLFLIVALYSKIKKDIKPQPIQNNTLLIKPFKSVQK